MISITEILGTSAIILVGAGIGDNHALMFQSWTGSYLSILAISALAVVIISYLITRIIIFLKRLNSK